MNVISRNSFYIYIALWIIYYLQDFLMVKGSIAQMTLVVLMVMSLCSFIKLNILYKVGAYINWLNILIIIITIYGLVLFLSGLALYSDEFNIKTGLEFGYLQRFFTSILPIYSFTLYSLQGQLSYKNMNHIFIVFLIFSILMYYQNYYVVSEEIGREEITNNMGYKFVPLIPMLSLVKMKDVWKYFFLIIIFVFIMMAMKRGAILVGVIALLLYMKHHLKANSTKQFVYILFLSIVAVCIIYFFIINLYETSDYFKSRLNHTMEGDTSLRSWMYPYYFDYFIHKTSGLEFLFGCGANATYLILGEYAHNDWLEFAINEGMFGVILYVIYWVVFVREWISYNGHTECKQTLGDLIVIYLLVSLFSMSFDGMPTAAALCIGFCIAANMRSKFKIVKRDGNTFIY